MNQSDIDKNVLYLNKMEYHLENFNHEKFRQFYYDHYGNTFSSGLQDFCIKENIDLIHAKTRASGGTTTINIGIFSTPTDELIDATGEITSTAKEAVNRIKVFSNKLLQIANMPHFLSSIGAFPELVVKFQLYIGRRDLGVKKYSEFRKKISSSVPPHKYLESIAKLMSIVPTWETDDFLLRYRENSDQIIIEITEIDVISFDSILDKARAMALTSYPFKDQELLKDILNSTTNERVVVRGLMRLEKRRENEKYFAQHIGSNNDGIRQEAALGIFDTKLLRKYYRKVNDWSTEVMEARIAQLEGDEETLGNIGKFPKAFPGAYVAIAAITNPEILKSISEFIRKKNPEEWTPRDKDSLTIIRSKEAFLRGDISELESNLNNTGFTFVEHFILDLINKLKKAKEIAPKVFISYKHESQSHRDWVKKLAMDLRLNGINAILDEWEIDLGESISDYMAREISESDAMLFVITELSLAAVDAERNSTSAVRFEFQIANARRYKDQKFRVIGLLRSGTLIPSHISDSLYIDFRDDGKYDEQLKKLILSLHGEHRLLRPPIIPRKSIE